MWSGLLIAVGPQWARNDLRSDLSRIDLLRSYPLDGGSVVRAESAGSAFIVTLAQLAMIAVGTTAIWHDPEIAISNPDRLPLLVAGVMVLPFVNYIGLMLFNGAAILFPAWVSPGATRGGVDTLGQNLLTAVAYTVALVVVLLVPTIIAGIVWNAFENWSVWGAVPGAVAAAAALILETWLLSLWLGRIFQRIDPPTAGIESTA